MNLKKIKESSSFKFFLVIVLLNIFFISISLLGAFKGDAKEFAKSILLTLYDNPFLGLLVGIIVTTVMQSSSATTSIVVSFVAGGFFGSDLDRSLYAAIPVIMGANIGTSTTNTIVSFGSMGDVAEFKRAASAATVHDIFNFIAVIIMFPLQVYTNFLGKLAVYFSGIFIGGTSVGTFKSPLDFIIKPQVKFIQSVMGYDFVIRLVVFFILSFVLLLILRLYIFELLKGSKKSKIFFYAMLIYLSISAVILGKYSSYILNSSFSVFSLGIMFLFLALNNFVKLMKDLASGKLEILFNSYFFKTPLTAFLVGLVITVIVQSSSITTSVIVPLAGAGIVSLNQVFPYTLGANVGTTVTALLASVSLGSVA